MYQYFYWGYRKEALCYQKAAVTKKTSQHLQTWLPRGRMTARMEWKLSDIFVLVISQCLSEHQKTGIL